MLTMCTTVQYNPLFFVVFGGAIQNSYDKHADICVGAKVAISNVNFLLEIGLYNGAIGDVIEIVYNNRPVGPNDKQHYHLPNYVVVNFPNLWLPTNIAPWDELQDGE